MKRLLLLFWGLFFIYFVSAFAGWTYPIQVNHDTLTEGIQGTRNSDTPWSMATDDSGNVHIVIETQDDDSCNLAIHYRVRNYNGDWGNELSVTATENVRNPPINHNSFGHPSIVVDNNLKGFISYVMNAGVPGDTTIEMRTREFNYQNPANPFGDYDYMSEPGFPYVSSFGGVGRKVPVMTKDSSGTVWGFWPYRVSVGGSNTFHIYYNTISDTDTMWGTEQELDVYELADSTYMVSMLNTKTDPAGNVHILFSMLANDTSSPYEVYWIWYDVGNEEWHGPELISEPHQPDGNNSTYAYGVFSGGTSDYLYHVVWEENHLFTGTNTVNYRCYHKEISDWDTEIIIATPDASKPCIAVDSYDKVHVVWQDSYDTTDWLFYKYYDPNNKEWSNVDTLPLDLNLLYYQIPMMVVDKWDNLHVTGTAKVDSLPEACEYEVFYTMYDAPPHISNLHLVKDESCQDSVVIAWTGKAEPDLDAYVVYRRFPSQNYDSLGSTTDTIFVDYGASYKKCDYMAMDNTSYYIVAIDDASQETYSDTLIVPCVYEQGKLIAGNVPSSFELDNNYPNPFNASTEIKYGLPLDSYVTLEIYDILGRKTATLVDEYQTAGYKSVIWDGNNDNGDVISSGLYFYRLTAAEFSFTKRMTLIK